MLIAETAGMFGFDGKFCKVYLVNRISRLVLWSSWGTNIRSSWPNALEDWYWWSPAEGIMG